MTVDEEGGSAEGLEQRVVETLIDLREERGWSQSELARRMVEAGWPKYTQMTVSRTEKGERPIRLNEVEALAQVFGVEMYALWNPRGLRHLSWAVQRVTEARRDLEMAIGKYLDAQIDLAHRADSVDYAAEDVAEVSIMASELLATPEQLAKLIRVREAGGSIDDVSAAVTQRTSREKTAEDRFWNAPQTERSFTKLFKDINGVDPEEA